MKQRKFGGKLRRRLIEKILEEMSVKKVLQSRPYTAVEIVLYVNHKLDGNFDTLKGIGFTKVSWPDEWDTEYGIDKATEKAAADIARQIAERDDAFVYVEALGLGVEEQLASYQVVAESLA